MQLSRWSTRVSWTLGHSEKQPPWCDSLFLPAGPQQRFGVSVIMAEKSCTIRTRKFMTNKLLMRRQFVSLRAARARRLRSLPPPEEPAKHASHAAVRGDACSLMPTARPAHLRLC